MGSAYFYHLTDQPLEATLPALVDRARQAGWTVEVRGPDPDLLARLDDALWTGPEDGFVPHGRAGGPHDARQPVLLCGPGEAAANSPACVMSVGGARIDAAETRALEPRVHPVRRPRPGRAGDRAGPVAAADRGGLRSTVLGPRGRTLDEEG